MCRSYRLNRVVKSAFAIGGFQQGTGTIPVPDWVDSTVADWISSEVGLMEAAWGSLDDISAIGFVHIPP